MVPLEDANFERWQSELSLKIPQIESVCIALLKETGEEIYTNEPMKMLIHESITQSLINPTLRALTAMPANPLCYQGLLTLGSTDLPSITIDCKVWHKEGELLIVGQLNWLQFTDHFNKLSHLNQEISNLQRQLIKEKMLLDKTLKELKATQAMLVHSEKMNAIGQLVAGVAHEINNPISFVSSNVFHLQSSFNNLKQAILNLRQIVYVSENQDSISMADEIMKEFDVTYLLEDLEDIFKGAKEGVSRIKKIVDNLRTFSRLDEAGHMTVDLIANLESTISIVEPEFNKLGITFTMEAPEKLMLECFPSELNQAVLNILINSTQAVEKFGEILLRVTEDAEKVTISISDNGCGISDEIKNKIFNPFFSTKPVGTGTGLGLSIAYKIINDLHKGNLTFETELRKGTTFFITLTKNAIIDD